MTPAGRRLLGTAITLVAAVAMGAIYAALNVSLEHPGFASGWTLFGIMVLLALYNVRKKLPFIPLLASTSWLRFHVYLGWLSVVAFVLHVGVALPNGPLEVALAVIYLGLAGSGALGLYLSRSLAARLTRRGENVIFERIPAFRTRLRRQAEAVALGAVENAGSMTMADFYAASLRSFFEAPRNYWRHIFRSNKGRQAINADIAAIERYLSPGEREALSEIRRLVTAKDDLDFQHALQATLKNWLLVHVPLTYCLAIITLVHVIAVYAGLGDVP